MRKFVSWRRVSTKTQGKSGLGLSAQKNIIDYFVKAEEGELIADYEEVYTGTELSGCRELRRAIEHCKNEDATLIIAKTDRFRSTLEALQILDEVGENNIFFCDLPHTDRFTLTLYFSIAEREALVISLRTKAALDAKKKRREPTGGTRELWGKNTNADRGDAILKASLASADSRLHKAKYNPHNVAFKEFMEDYESLYGKITDDTDWKPIVKRLNDRGKKTATGLPFNINRAKAMYTKVKNLYR